MPLDIGVGQPQKQFLFTFVSIGHFKSSSSAPALPIRYINPKLRSPAAVLNANLKLSGSRLAISVAKLSLLPRIFFLSTCPEAMAYRVFRARLRALGAERPARTTSIIRRSRSAMQNQVFHRKPRQINESKSHRWEPKCSILKSSCPTFPPQWRSFS